MQAGKALLNGLFTLNPILRNALFRLRGLCIGVEEWSLFEYSKAKTYTLDEFVELQVGCLLCVCYPHLLHHVSLFHLW